MCGVYAYALVWVCVDASAFAHVCIFRGQRPTSDIFLPSLSTLVFETSEPGAHGFSYTGWPCKPLGSTHFHTQSCDYRQTFTTSVPGFYVDVGDPDSGPHVSMAYTLPTEPSSQSTRLISYNRTDLYNLTDKIGSVLDEWLAVSPRITAQEKLPGGRPLPL